MKATIFKNEACLDVEIIDVVVNTKDYPDFCDSYITEALINGQEASDEEIDELNENADLVYEACLWKLY